MERKIPNDLIKDGSEKKYNCTNEERLVIDRTAKEGSPRVENSSCKMSKFWRQHNDYG